MNMVGVALTPSLVAQHDVLFYFRGRALVIHAAAQQAANPHSFCLAYSCSLASKFSSCDVLLVGVDPIVA